MRQRCVVTFLTALATLVQPAATDPPRGPQLVVLRAQPSVLQVIMAIDVDFKRPSDIGTKPAGSDRTVFEQEYAAAAASLPPGTDRGRFCWQRVAEDPGRYLELRGKDVTFTIANRPYATGTGFVVDQTGTLLTNQHVIEPRLVPRDARALAGLLDEDLGNFVKAVVQVVGEPPPDDLVPAIDRAFVPWVLTHYECTDVRRSEVRLATHLLPGTLPRQLSIKAAPPAPDWKKSTVACEVLVTGEPYPGRDVAVIRAPSIAGRLISLPLGDASRFLLGSNVYALGFPGLAVVDGVDPEAARFRVIAHDGIIDQRLPLQTGWEIFHMTANINHGDSGGPVLDEKGRVVAITVAGNFEQTAAQNLAIPIDIAREFLARAKVVAPLRNEVTTEWNAGCDALEAGKYGDALPHFEKVERLQGGWVFGAKTGGSQAGELIELCKREGAVSTAQLPPGVKIGGLRPAAKPDVPKLQLGSPAQDKSWWEIAWDVVVNLPLLQKILLAVLLLSALGGVLKLIGRLF